MSRASLPPLSFLWHVAFLKANMAILDLRGLPDDQARCVLRSVAPAYWFVVALRVVRAASRMHAIISLSKSPLLYRV